jgi:hypothetical protein
MWASGKHYRSFIYSTSSINIVLKLHEFNILFITCQKLRPFEVNGYVIKYNKLSRMIESCLT